MADPCVTRASGLIEQKIPFGYVSANVTVPPNPFRELTTIIDVVLLSVFPSIRVGVADIEKSAGAITTKITDEA